MKKRKIFYIALAVLILIGLPIIVFFGKNSQSKSKNLNIATLKGPTGLGFLHLMEGGNLFQDNYKFDINTQPDTVAAKLISGEADIAAVPSNMASILYNKTNANIKILAINVLGMLKLISCDDSIKNISDLKDKQIFSSGQGATPEYAINFILQANNVKLDQDIQYMPDHSSLVKFLLSGKAKTAILPEPFASQVILKDPKFKKIIDLNDEWQNAVKIENLDESDLVMGCIVARSDFVESNKPLIDEFLAKFKDSVVQLENIDVSAELAQKHDIMDKSITMQALPECGIVCITSKEMPKKLDGYFKIIYNYNASAIGGKLPNGDIYY